jgi:hypothetical protein
MQCLERCTPSQRLQVSLPVDKGVVLLDIGFTGSDPNHGVFVVGNAQKTVPVE